MKKVKSPKIAVFGVGSAGCHLLNLIAKSDIGDKVKLIAVDEERKGVYSRNADAKIALKKGAPRSLRQPKLPEEGRDDALEVYDEIIEAILQ